MTTYITKSDLNSVLEGFVEAYYGTTIGTAFSIGTQYGDDMYLSYQKVNEMLFGIGHIKQVPIGTQRDGNFPFAVRIMQANFMVYQRLLGRHYGEISGGDIPGWINVFRTRAMEAYSDIKGQDVVFADDVTQGESGIGIGTWKTKSGTVNLYTNWEAGSYTAYDWPRNYVIEIDGTTDGSRIGQSTFKWSRDGGDSWATTLATTGTNWYHVENGFCVRWETVISGTEAVYAQHAFGDRFEVTCVPQNVPVKSGNVRFVTFRRG